MSEGMKKITMPFEPDEISTIDEFLADTNVARVQLMQWLISDFVAEIKNLDRLEEVLEQEAEEGIESKGEPPSVSFGVGTIMRLKKKHPWPLLWNLKTKEK